MSENGIPKIAMSYDGESSHAELIIDDLVFLGEPDQVRVAYTLLTNTCEQSHIARARLTWLIDRLNSWLRIVDR
jgi:hypothetical protein